MDKIEELLTRGVANTIPGKEELNKILASGKKLNVYLGIDPTATKIHLGHAVTLRKLNQFAQLGHNVTFVIGDFTALIGDTSDKDTERPVLTSEQIQENFKTYKMQAEKILDFSKVQVRNNSEWLKKLSFEEIVKLCQRFSVGDFISRELIKKRLNEGKRVGLHEVLYPIMQGYDSLMLDTDIQIGGTDQTFNMQAGRTLIKELKNKESFVFAMEFLMGTDGRKMSKSWGNAIWLNDSPNDMYAKVLAINDDLIHQYFVLGTNIDLPEIEKIKEGRGPMDIKKELAKIIVTELHNANAAKLAQENFEKSVQRKEQPSEVKELLLPESFEDNYDLLVKIGIRNSKSEIKRLIEQGGIIIDGVNLKDKKEFEIEHGSMIQVGKRSFFKIKA